MNKNILLVANWDSNVGYAWWLMENYWNAINAHFSKQGQKCYLIYPTVSTLPKIIEDSSIITIEHDYENNNINGLIALQKIIKQEKIDTIYLSDKPYSHWKYVLLRVFGIKNIFLHDHTPGEYSISCGKKKIIKSIVSRLPVINASHYIAVTSYIHKRMIDSACLPGWKCSVAQNGINHIGRNPKHKYYAHDEFKVPRDATIIITSGRATYYKGIDFIIRCTASLIHQQKMDNLYVLYCGDGPDISDFKKLVVELAIDSRFIFAGKRVDVDMLLQSCHIGIQASQGEVGYSLSILEYMSAGLATIVPDLASTCLAIEDNKTGVYYQAGNEKSAILALEKFILDTEYRHQISAAAMKSVTNQYALSTANEQLIGIFETQLRVVRS